MADVIFGGKALDIDYLNANLLLSSIVVQL